MDTERLSPDEYDHWMARALDLAEQAASVGEVPVGAVVLDKDGKLIGEGYNRPISEHDPSAHAEIMALRSAAAHVSNYRLPGSTLVVTLEPCAMCAGAIAQARVSRLVFGADDPKGGAVHHGPKIFDQPTTHHKIEITGGILAERSSKLLRGFFAARRA